MGITKAERDGLKPKGAKSFEQKQPIEKEVVIIKSKPVKKESRIFLNEYLSVSNLTKNIEKFIEQGVQISLWGGKRQNDKLDIQNDKIVLLNSYLLGLKDIGLNLTEIKIDDLFSKTFIKKMVEFKSEDLEMDFKLELANKKAELAKHDFDKVSKKKYLEKIDIFLDKLDLENESLDQDIELKVSKVKMHEEVIAKFKDGTIKDIPMEILHELFNFFNNGDNNSIEAIAKYQKVIGDLDKTQAESMKTYTESQKNIADSQAKDLNTLMLYDKFKRNQEDNKNQA